MATKLEDKKKANETNKEKAETKSVKDAKRKTVENKDVVEGEAEKENKALKEQLASMSAMLEEIKNSKPQEQPQVIIENKSNSNKNIKVTSLVSHMYVLSTSTGANRVKIYKFSRFGESINIRFNDMVDILSNASFIRAFENGELIINNREDAVSLDMEYLYDDAMKTKELQSLIKAEQFSDVEVILNLSKSMQDSIAHIIAERMADGERYDMNIVKELENNGLKIMDIYEATVGYRKDEEES